MLLPRVPTILSTAYPSPSPLVVLFVLPLAFYVAFYVYGLLFIVCSAPLPNMHAQGVDVRACVCV